MILYKINFMIRYLLLLLLVSFSVANPRFGDEEKMKTHLHHQVPSNAPNLTVHLIPHSHDDVGWLKTVDEYYYGGSQKIQFAAVQYTIDTVVSELWANPTYKFVIVQMAFLYRWWNNADEDQKQKMKELIKKGQLQFINGGWCMSDEATVYYQDFIDQMTIGLRWLKDTFEYIPDVAWHIDPFGHQSSSATMFNKMGFQSFFFARIDYQDKQKRMSEKSLEMIWKPDQTVSESNNYIFTHVNYFLYRSPPGFCFDVRCQDEPIMDDVSMEEYNLVSRSQQFVNYFKSMSLHYRTSNLMHNMGGDFQYSNARMYFKNMDKLMNFINARPQYGIKFIYSTPSNYIKAIREQGVTYPTKSDDFLPYADEDHAYWTGFFTSRTAVKGFVRDFGRWLQSVRKHVSQLKISNTSNIINGQGKQLEESLWEMQTAMGILQHHDAVSGTQKQKVADNYIFTASKAIGRFENIYKRIIKEEFLKQIGESTIQNSVHFNLFWNETATQTGVADAILKNRTVILSLYNPGHTQERQIRVSVPEHPLRVVDDKNNVIEGDIFCANLHDKEDCELVFLLNMTESANRYVKLIPTKTAASSASVVKLKQLTIIQSSKQFFISETTSVKITKASQQFDIKFGLLRESFTITYDYYESYQGDGQKSGAYIFRPANDTAQKYSTIKTIHYAEGNINFIIVLEGDKTNTKVIFSKTDGYLEHYGFQVQTFIDSIKLDKSGKQVVMNVNTNFFNKGIFYTDSNGLEEQQRKLNYRPTWPLVVNEEVAGNFYPVNSHIGVQNQGGKNRFTVLPDRSQAGSVLKDGQIQMMIHRRILEDDDRGVNEPLDETEADGSGLKQRVRHCVVFGSDYRKVQLDKDQKVKVTIAQTNSAPFSKVNLRQCPIKVPSGVKLYLRPFTDNSYLLRLQNFNARQTAVQLPDGWTISEMTLSANQLKKDWQQAQYKWSQQEVEQQGWWNWIKQEISKVHDMWRSESEKNGQSVSLNFLEIKTFKLIKFT